MNVELKNLMIRVGLWIAALLVVSDSFANRCHSLLTQVGLISSEMKSAKLFDRMLNLHISQPRQEILDALREMQFLAVANAGRILNDRDVQSSLSRDLISYFQLSRSRHLYKADVLWQRASKLSAEFERAHSMAEWKHQLVNHWVSRLQAESMLSLDWAADAQEKQRAGHLAHALESLAHGGAFEQRKWLVLRSENRRAHLDGLGVIKAHELEAASRVQLVKFSDAIFADDVAVSAVKAFSDLTFAQKALTSQLVEYARGPEELRKYPFEIRSRDRAADYYLHWLSQAADKAERALTAANILKDLVPEFGPHLKNEIDQAQKIADLIETLFKY